MNSSLRPRDLGTAALCAAVALGLAACGKSSQPATPAATPPAPSSVPAPMKPLPVPPTARTSAPAPAASVPHAMSGSAAVLPAASTLSVAHVNVGSHIDKDYNVTHAAQRFASDDHTLYAAVRTTGKATGANLRALWTYQDGQTVNDTAQSITADGPATTTFEVHNRNDWPTGKYKVAISLDGKPAGTQEFEIVSR